MELTPRTKRMVGLLSGALTTFSFIPQTWTLWRMAPRPAPDVSLWMYCIIVAGGAGWLVYGFLLRDLPMKLANGVALLFTGSILLYKLLYG